MLKELLDHQDMKGTKREFMVHDSPQNGVSKRGIRTRAEQARALLLASGLPRFLWKEAMKHSAWLQDQIPASALKGKTLYKMGNKRKPNLNGIQEFGATAYIKDLTAGKLDARAKKGCFVGYNSESKGYRIYWPKKRSITVERNIVFNQADINSSDNLAIIYGEAESKGEKEKIIQSLQNNAEDVNKLENEDSESQEQQWNLTKAQKPQTPFNSPLPMTFNLNLNPKLNHTTTSSLQLNSMVMVTEINLRKAHMKP